MTHEYLACDSDYCGIDLDGFRVIEHADSSRRESGEKTREDAALLEEELAIHPNEPRTVFYAARTYEDAGWIAKAVDLYRRRLSLGGYADEVFYSRFRIGCLTSDLAELLASWSSCPERWEPVHAACQIMNRAKSYHSAYALSKHALSVKPTASGLFLHAQVYDYLLLCEHAVAAYHIGHYRESHESCMRLLSKDLPADLELLARKNMRISEMKMKAMSAAIYPR